MSNSVVKWKELMDLLEETTIEEVIDLIKLQKYRDEVAKRIGYYPYAEGDQIEQRVSSQDNPVPWSEPSNIIKSFDKVEREEPNPWLNFFPGKKPEDPVFNWYESSQLKTYREMQKQRTEKEDANPNSPLSRQVGGDHYRSLPIQPVEYIYHNGIGFHEGSVIKYVSRWNREGGKGLQDLEKALHFLEILINFEKERERDGKPKPGGVPPETLG